MISTKDKYYYLKPEEFGGFHRIRGEVRGIWGIEPVLMMSDIRKYCKDYGYRLPTNVGYVSCFAGEIAYRKLRGCGFLLCKNLELGPREFSLHLDKEYKSVGGFHPTTGGVICV